jgi:hypothetical protein
LAPPTIAAGPAAAPNADAARGKLTLTADPATTVGVYVVRVRTDDGISNPFLLAVGQVPQVAEAEDNSTFEAAQAVPSPAVVEGQAAGNDVDYFKFPGKKGLRIVVDAQCARIGSGVDPQIRLTTAARAFVAAADDTAGLLTDARLTAVLPEDTDYVVELSDSRYQGGGRPVYRLLIGRCRRPTRSIRSAAAGGRPSASSCGAGPCPASPGPPCSWTPRPGSRSSASTSRTGCWARPARPTRPSSSRRSPRWPSTTCPSCTSRSSRPPAR